MNEKDYGYQQRGPGDYVEQPNWGLLANLIAGFLGYKAGKNHYQQDGDVAAAARVGVGAYARWMVWMLALFIWFWWNLILASWVAGNAWPSIGAVLVAPFTLGVTWCRNIDYCLFRRGLIYRLYAPVARMCEAVPTWALYLGLVAAMMV